MFEHRPWIVGVAAAAALPVGVTTAAETRPKASNSRANLHASLAGHHSMGGQMHEVVRDDLLARHLTLHRRVARLEGRRIDRQAVRMTHRLSASQLAAANRALHARAEELEVPADPVLRRIAQCESGGNPRAIGGGGMYRGAFQFSQSTWEAVGGSGDPAAAPLGEQYRRAAILLARSGPGQWPVCA